MIWTSFLLGCADVHLSTEQPTCVDVELDGEPELISTEDGDDLIFSKTISLAGNHDVFDPDINFEGRTLRVREYWTASTETTAELCFSPAVRLADPPGGKYEVWWFDGDEGTPWSILEMKH